MERLKLQTELEQKYYSLPLSVKCYFEWEKQKREPVITPSERIDLERHQFIIRSRWNQKEIMEFYDYLLLQQRFLKEVSKLEKINNDQS